MPAAPPRSPRTSASQQIPTPSGPASCRATCRRLPTSALRPCSGIDQGAVPPPLPQPRPPRGRPNEHVVGQGDPRQVAPCSRRGRRTSPGVTRCSIGAGSLSPTPAGHLARELKLNIAWDDTPRYWRWIPPQHRLQK